MVKLILSFFIFITLTNAQSDLSNRIQKIISSLPSSTKASGYIIDANTGEEIFSKDIEKSMIPASNTKLFTTGAALYLMGPKHEFTTKILTNNPEIKDGILDGDLFIKGFGHSTFGYKDFDSLISLFIKSDVKVITGNIIGDDYYFDNLYTRDDWIIDERANVKLPPVSALVINRNQLVITLNASGNERSKLRYSIKPDFSFINVDMNAVVTRNRSYPRISTSFNKNQLNIKVNNGLRKRRTPLRYAVNIENPPLFFALALKESDQSYDWVNIPGNIGDDYVVYVNDVDNPTQVNGFRNGETWFNANGDVIEDPSTLRGAAGIAPWLLEPGQERPSGDAFERYKPSVNFMPRIAFSFPISDEAIM